MNSTAFQPRMSRTMTPMAFGTFRLIYQPTAACEPAMQAVFATFGHSRHTYALWAQLLRNAWLELRLS